MLTYKGYIGTVEFSAEDKVFWGKIHGINSLVTFESDNASELENAFKEAVEDYLDLCAKHNIQPEKTFKGNFNVRIKPELHKRLYEVSIQEHISLNAVIEKGLEKIYC